MPTYKNIEARAYGLEPQWNADRTAQVDVRLVLPGETFIARAEDVPLGPLNVGAIIKLSDEPLDIDPPAKAKVR